MSPKIDIHGTPATAEPAALSYADPADPLWKRLLISSIEWMLGRPALQRSYDRVRRLPVPDHELWFEARKEIGVAVDFRGFPLENIRKNGPLILVANHPFGVVDGLILCEMAARIDPDFRVLINSVLTRDRRVGRFFIPVDFSETPEALATNLASRNRCLDLLEAGGTLLLFPAGGVATAGPFERTAQELDWKPFVMKLIGRSRATILPVRVEGQNSRIFHLASAVHLSLRLALLLHEIRNKRGKTIRVHTGAPLAPETLDAVPRSERLAWLKRHVESLGQDAG